MAAGLAELGLDPFFCQRIFGIVSLRHGNVSTKTQRRVCKGHTYDDVEETCKSRGEQ